MALPYMNSEQAAMFNYCIYIVSSHKSAEFEKSYSNIRAPLKMLKILDER